MNIYSIINADFPYYVSKYISHKILWFNLIDYDYAIKIIKLKFSKNNLIIFQNNFENRSIKNIIHFHFFIKNLYIIL